MKRGLRTTSDDSRFTDVSPFAEQALNEPLLFAHRYLLDWLALQIRTLRSLRPPRLALAGGGILMMAASNDHRSGAAGTPDGRQAQLDKAMWDIFRPFLDGRDDRRGEVVLTANDLAAFGMEDYPIHDPVWLEQLDAVLQETFTVRRPAFGLPDARERAISLLRAAGVQSIRLNFKASGLNPAETISKEAESRLLERLRTRYLTVHFLGLQAYYPKEEHQAAFARFLLSDDMPWSDKPERAQKLRNIFLAREVEGLTAKEAANRLQLPLYGINNVATPLVHLVCWQAVAFEIRRRVTAGESIQEFLTKPISGLDLPSGTHLKLSHHKTDTFGALISKTSQELGLMVGPKWAAHIEEDLKPFSLSLKQEPDKPHVQKGLHEGRAAAHTHYDEKDIAVRLLMAVWPAPGVPEVTLRNHEAAALIHDNPPKRILNNNDPLVARINAALVGLFQSVDLTEPVREAVDQLKAAGVNAVRLVKKVRRNKNSPTAELEAERLLEALNTRSDRRPELIVSKSQLARDTGVPLSTYHKKTERVNEIQVIINQLMTQDLDGREDWLAQLARRLTEGGVQKIFLMTDRRSRPGCNAGGKPAKARKTFDAGATALKLLESFEEESAREAPGRVHLSLQETLDRLENPWTLNTLRHQAGKQQAIRGQINASFSDNPVTPVSPELRRKALELHAKGITGIDIGGYAASSAKPVSSRKKFDAGATALQLLQSFKKETAREVPGRVHLSLQEVLDRIGNPWTLGTFMGNRSRIHAIKEQVKESFKDESAIPVSPELHQEALELQAKGIIGIDIGGRVYVSGAPRAPRQPRAPRTSTGSRKPRLTDEERAARAARVAADKAAKTAERKAQREARKKLNAGKPKERILHVRGRGEEQAVVMSSVSRMTPEQIEAMRRDAATREAARAQKPQDRPSAWHRLHGLEEGKILPLIPTVLPEKLAAKATPVPSQRIRTRYALDGEIAERYKRFPYLAMADAFLDAVDPVPASEYGVWYVPADAAAGRLRGFDVDLKDKGQRDRFNAALETLLEADQPGQEGQWSFMVLSRLAHFRKARVSRIVVYPDLPSPAELLRFLQAILLRSQLAAEVQFSSRRLAALLEVPFPVLWNNADLLGEVNRLLRIFLRPMRPSPKAANDLRPAVWDRWQAVRNKGYTSVEFTDPHAKPLKPEDFVPHRWPLASAA